MFTLDCCSTKTVVETKNFQPCKTFAPVNQQQKCMTVSYTAAAAAVQNVQQYKQTVVVVVVSNTSLQLPSVSLGLPNTTAEDNQSQFPKKVTNTTTALNIQRRASGN